MLNLSPKFITMLISIGMTGITTAIVVVTQRNVQIGKSRSSMYSHSTHCIHAYNRATWKQKGRSCYSTSDSASTIKLHQYLITSLHNIGALAIVITRSPKIVLVFI